jgi:hypothetical protein
MYLAFDMLSIQISIAAVMTIKFTPSFKTYIIAKAESASALHSAFTRSTIFFLLLSYLPVMKNKESSTA